MPLSRLQKVFLALIVAVNLCGFIAWTLLMERIHVAPRQPDATTGQTVPLHYKGTIRYIQPRDDWFLQWSGTWWPFAVLFGEGAVLVLLGRVKSKQGNIEQ